MKNKIFKINLIIFLLIFSIEKIITFNFNNNDEKLNLYDEEGYYNPKVFIDHPYQEDIVPIFNSIKNEDVREAMDFARNINYFNNNWNNKGVNLYNKKGFYDPEAFFILNQKIIPKYNNFKNEDEKNKAWDFSRNIRIFNDFNDNYNNWKNRE